MQVREIMHEGTYRFRPLRSYIVFSVTRVTSAPVKRHGEDVADEEFDGQSMRQAPEEGSGQRSRLQVLDVFQ